MILNERTERRTNALNAARMMMTAARTAPKGKGMDIIEVSIATDDDILRLSEKLYQLSDEMQHPFMKRDAANILNAEAVLLIGTRTHTHGLNCGHCGYSTCAGKPLPVPCALNTVDVGIALGSVCAMAADLRLDTRVMFSAGLAAQKLGYLGDSHTVFALPISISSKNTFFDRG
ncbi:MAG: DUF2148 domain-containing protein [Tannerellaceae bacterium]|jgi:uncharacterized ferredoxin-like protein|nr:DUF2148 domain-containing protein [Tannerellaceae bacterium]